MQRHTRSCPLRMLAPVLANDSWLWGLPWGVVDRLGDVPLGKNWFFGFPVGINRK